MRLIDADKAERDIEELRKSHWFNSPYLTKERKIGLSEAFDMIQGVCIKHAPTVDAEPVKHGRWTRDEFGTKCGACGLYAYRDKFDQPWESRYCPNCGAKMGDNDE